MGIDRLFITGKRKSDVVVFQFKFLILWRSLASVHFYALGLCKRVGCRQNERPSRVDIGSIDCITVRPITIAFIVPNYGG